MLVLLPFPQIKASYSQIRLPEDFIPQRSSKVVTGSILLFLPIPTDITEDL